jgi:hypothetical protein
MYVKKHIFIQSFQLKTRKKRKLLIFSKINLDLNRSNYSFFIEMYLLKNLEIFFLILSFLIKKRVKQLCIFGVMIVYKKRNQS